MASQLAASASPCAEPSSPIQLRAPTDDLAQRVADGRVRRRQLAQVALQAIGVGVDDERPAVASLDAQKLVVVDDLAAGEGAELLPDAVERRAGACTHQPLEAAVEDVAVAPPGGADSTGQPVHLEDLGPVPVHLGVAAGGQASHAGPDDGDRSVSHGPRPFHVLHDRDGTRRQSTNLVVTLRIPSSDCRPGSAG